MMKVNYFEQNVGPAVVLTVPVLGDNYSYLMAADGVAAAVDPAAAAPLAALCEQRGLRIDVILATHHHFDHVAGCRELQKRTGCRVAGPADERIPALDHPLRGGDRLAVGSLSLNVLATPGHTRSHLCFFLPAGPALWSGDCLFAGGCGRLIEGDAPAMWTSLQSLLALPDSTWVFCGHEYTLENLQFGLSIDPKSEALRRRVDETRTTLRSGRPTVPSTLALEKATNPFLLADDASWRAAHGWGDLSAAECFAELRRRKDEFG